MSLDIRIDKEELARIKQQRASEQVLSEEFISFEYESGAEEGGPSREETLNLKNRRITSLHPPTFTPTPSSFPSLPPSKSPPTHKRPPSLLRFDVPWMDTRRHRYSTNATERLHQEIVDFANYVSPTEEERFARSEAIQRVEQIVHTLWPAANMRVFGSFDSQLYLPSSDLDLVILLNDPTQVEDQYTRPPLKRLAKALLKAAIPEPDSLKIISKARVPIVKYTDAATSFVVDISFNTTSGLEAAAFMRREMRMQPAIRPLTLLLKHFLSMRSLKEVFTGGLGSYSVMCLVISLLQTHPLIQAGLVRPHENLGVLLMDLLELYGRNFNYQVTGISVRDGGSYFRKEDRGWLQEGRPHLLSIEDPQNEDNDISKGSFAIGAVRQAFEHAFNILRAAIAEFERYQERHPERAAMEAPDRHHRQRQIHTPSILGSIITLNDKLLRHRYYIQQTTNF